MRYYTDSPKNARLENGHLILEGYKEKIANANFVSTEAENWKENREFTDYSSASLTTQDMGEWTYGKIEVKVKLPKGPGIWPAIWTLGKNQEEVRWLECGEIDIMEHVGFNKKFLETNFPEGKP